MESTIYTEYRIMMKVDGKWTGGHANNPFWNNHFRSRDNAKASLVVLKEFWSNPRKRPPQMPIPTDWRIDYRQVQVTGWSKEEGDYDN